MKPIEGIWSDAELARPNVKEPEKLSNYFLLYRFLSFVQWGEVKQSKPETRLDLKRGEKFELDLQRN